MLVSPEKTLFDLGFKIEDCDPVDDHPIRYDCSVKGKALNKIKTAVSENGRSHYSITSDKKTNGALYSIKFTLSDKTSYTFIIDDFEQEQSGKFIGYYNDPKK